ncbi:MAG: ATP-grasp domain-containing protein [Anaerolineae bacterium]
MTYDLCIAWNWEYDADFIALLEAACQERGLSLLQITPDNLAHASQKLANGELAFRVLLDRASDADAEFLSVVDWARKAGVRCINACEKARRAWDKAAMHLAFVRAGVLVPHALILPPYDELPELPMLDLSPLGATFTIKPACRGGGEGVINEATSWQEVLTARQTYPQEGYLLQARVVPAQLGARPAWFRIIYCIEQIYPCWWDVQSHQYTPLSAVEETQYALTPLRHITAQIASLCGLEHFSTEIALSIDGSFLAVDYVNDPIDLRLQSKTSDGVPDDIVRGIAQRLASLAAAARLLPGESLSLDQSR